jgi:hypothetical protein
LIKRPACIPSSNEKSRNMSKEKQDRSRHKTGNGIKTGNLNSMYS